MESFSKDWEANEELLKKIEIIVSSQYSGQKGIHFNDNWEEILFKGFFTGLNRMKAIQFLLNPANKQNFLMESASLVRNLWEIWLLLAWMNHHDVNEREKRINQFKNTSIMDQGILNRAYNELFPREVQKEDLWYQEEAQRIEGQFPRKSWKVPNNSELMKEIATRDQRYENSHSLYYKTVYKDFSHYVHLTWRTITEVSLSPTETETYVYPELDLGGKCVEISWGFFLFITEIWNNFFKVIPDEKFDNWAKARLKIQSEGKGLSA